MVEVAPGMSVKVRVPSVLTCHWTFGVRLPVAASVNVTVCPTVRAYESGSVLIRGPDAGATTVIETVAVVLVR